MCAGGRLPAMAPGAPAGRIELNRRFGGGPLEERFAPAAMNRMDRRMNPWEALDDPGCSGPGDGTSGVSGGFSLELGKNGRNRRKVKILNTNSSTGRGQTICGTENGAGGRDRTPV